MKKDFVQLLLGIFLILLMISSYSYGQLSGGDLLNETPLLTIPQEMTFEEYRDMNRRISMGLLISAVPVPGLIHDYANEKKSARKIRWISGSSLAIIVLGALSLEEGDFPDSDYHLQIINEGLDNERRFEMIESGYENNEITYELSELYRSNEGLGNILIPLGIMTLVGTTLYDYIHGIYIIEKKRDTVRFKYGKKLNLSIKPAYQLQSKTSGIALSYSFLI